MDPNATMEPPRNKSRNSINRTDAFKQLNASRERILQGGINQGVHLKSALTKVLKK